MDMSSVFASRRDQLLQRLQPSSAVIIPGHDLTIRNSDVDHRFRQRSDLWYLTGFTEPESAAVLRNAKGDSASSLTMFVRPRDPERETWNGRRAGVDGAKARYGADQAFDSATVATELPKLLDGIDTLYYIPGEDPKWDQLIWNALKTLRQGERRGMRAPRQIVDLRTTLHELRLIKDDDALQKLRRASDVAAAAHNLAMATARGGMREYEIEALIEYQFRKVGGHAGYGTIVGAGDNANILHYVECSDEMKQGDLLLIDAGCEIDGFTSDITRAFPIGARFTPAQRRFYQTVLDVEKSCIAMTKPGVTIDDIHAHAVRKLTEGMVELGLLSGSVDTLIEKGDYRKFYMHRTSHWLGMDVHDVGSYTNADGKPRPLQPGMVLTIEPGLYVSAAAENVPDEYRGLGVRIEDDVLVTAKGMKNLSAKIPSEAGAVEKWMKRFS